MTIAFSTARQRIREEVSIRCYQSEKDALWRWQIKNRGNHEIEGASSQGYADPRDCRSNLARVTGWEADEDETDAKDEPQKSETA